MAVWKRVAFILLSHRDIPCCVRSQISRRKVFVDFLRRLRDIDDNTRVADSFLRDHVPHISFRDWSVRRPNQNFDLTCTRAQDVRITPRWLKWEKYLITGCYQLTVVMPPIVRAPTGAKPITTTSMPLR